MDRRGGNRPRGTQAIHRLVGLPLFLVPLVAGCFQTARIHTAQHNYYQGKFDLAAQRLDPDEIPKRDALLALLEQGMAFQAAGRYAESAAAWRRAEDLMEQQDVFHAGEQALSLLLDQNILAYRPAPYDKPFLHSLLALDYLALGDVPSARVEAVKSLRDLEKRESVVGPIAFVRYVAALCYEASGDVNDAYIEYKKIHKSGVPGFLPALVRLSAALGMEDEHARFHAEHAADTVEPPDDETGPPAILFIGKSPKKVASEVVLEEDYKLLLPVFQPQVNPIRGARAPTASGSARSSIPLTSVETLAANYSGRLFAKELLKEVLRRKVQKRIVKKVGDKVGSAAETLLKTVFFFALEADLRTWSSLPAEFHLLRAPPDSGGVPFEWTGEPSGISDTVSAPAGNSRVRMYRAW